MKSMGAYLSAVVLTWLCGGPAWAVEVNVVGLFSGKALVEINGSQPRTLAVGQTGAGGVKLISADSNQAVFEIDGKRETLRMGQKISAHYAPAVKPVVMLTADAKGHFVTTGSINGASTRFLVDTGASTVAMSSSEAQRLGISYLRGERGYGSTANGMVSVYRVMLNEVRLGDITLNQVEGAVIEGGGMPATLLGMSFLSRLEMRREGTTMTLVKQY